MTTEKSCAQPAQNHWQRCDSTFRPREDDNPYYGVMRLRSGEQTDGMAALRHLFPEGQADDLNFVLFSTSGVHGSYCTIEDAEAEPDLGVTFLIVQPRIVGLRYGNCEPKTPEDFAFLKTLRASSLKAVATIGVEP